MAFPELWIVAGPNGAGKSTTVQKEPISGWLPAVPFFNPDDRTLDKLRTAGFDGFPDAPDEVQHRLFIESANEVSAELEAAMQRSEAVGIETVLSSRKYQSVVESVLSHAGVVGLIYVALSTPEIALERVAARVRRGGHGVPDDRVVERWHRSIELLPWFARRATVFWIVDNSESNPDNRPRLLASGRGGLLEYHSADVFPELRSALAKLTR